ncbi:4Fe-4S dicluster domain-containing protein [Deferrisoma sp.]
MLHPPGPEDYCLARVRTPLDGGLDRREFLRRTAAGASLVALCLLLPRRSQGAPGEEQPPTLVVVDVKKCVGCRICEVECARKNYKTYNPRHANLQVIHLVPPVSVPNHCYLCKDSPCIAECPVVVDAKTGKRALYHDPKVKGLKLDNVACTGCWKCVDVCQRERSGILRRNEASKRPEGFCTLCDGDPSCVKFCPNDAMARVPVTFDGRYLARNPYLLGQELAKLWYR